MKIYKLLGVFILSASFLFVSCDAEEENIDWRAGDSLIIQGSAAVVAGTEGEPYYVEGFTVEEEYNWTLNGSAIEPDSEGQFIYVNFPTAGTYTITVSNGIYDGELTVNAAVE